MWMQWLGVALHHTIPLLLFLAKKKTKTKLFHFYYLLKKKENSTFVVAFVVCLASGGRECRWTYSNDGFAHGRLSCLPQLSHVHLWGLWSTVELSMGTTRILWSAQILLFVSNLLHKIPTQNKIVSQIYEINPTKQVNK